MKPFLLARSQNSSRMLRCSLWLFLAGAGSVGASACASTKPRAPTLAESVQNDLSRSTGRCVVHVTSDSGDGSTPGLHICISTDSTTRSKQGFLGALLTVNEAESACLAPLFVKHLHALASLPDSVTTRKGASFSVNVEGETSPRYQCLPNVGIAITLLNGVKNEVKLHPFPLRGEVKQNLIAAIEYNVLWMTPTTQR